MTSDTAPAWLLAARPVDMDRPRVVSPVALQAVLALLLLGAGVQRGRVVALLEARPLRDGRRDRSPRHRAVASSG